MQYKDLEGTIMDKTKHVKLAYSTLFNAGDLMNVDIVEKLSHRKVIKSATIPADMTAIGGQLYGLQYSDKFFKRILQFVAGAICDIKPIYIWGSGFLHDRNKHGLCRKNIQVCALRGRKSQEKLSKLTGKEYHVVLADAGLLVDQLLDPAVKIEKIYEIGLIPHMYQQQEVKMQEIMAMPNVHMIDIKRTPQEVTYDIARCEVILSSSLHGLIFADALHIPNLHIKGMTDLPEGNFKFEDYYSSYGLNDQIFDTSTDELSVQWIKSAYRIDALEVEEKKRKLIDCFPIK